jgi:hypothetical protein
MSGLGFGFDQQAKMAPFALLQRCLKMALR